MADTAAGNKTKVKGKKFRRSTNRAPAKKEFLLVTEAP